jgi:hypothetical protein
MLVDTLLEQTDFNECTLDNIKKEIVNSLIQV